LGLKGAWLLRGPMAKPMMAAPWRRRITGRTMI
jgi:hypothetical protein